MVKRARFLKPKSPEQLKVAFLAAIAEHGPNLEYAARKAGSNRRLIFRLREEDPEFAQAVEEAQQAAVGEVKASIHERALNRVDPGTGKRPYDGRDSILAAMFEIKAYDPAWRENHKTEVNIAGDVHFTLAPTKPADLQLAGPIIQQLPSGGGDLDDEDE